MLGLGAMLPVVKFLLVGGGAVAGASAIGTGVGAVLGSLWLAADRTVRWADWMGLGGGLGAVFGSGVVFIAVATGTLY
jgi:hypothetical protein